MKTAWLSMAIAWSCVGCSPSAQDDYTLYVVAFGEPDRSDGCFGQEQPDPDRIEDSSSFLGLDYLATFAVDDSYFLHMGDIAIEGTLDGDTYDFLGEFVDVDYSGQNDNRRTEFTRTNHFRFTRDGETISGTLTLENFEVCEGPTCPASTSLPCTQTGPMNGRRIRGEEAPFDLLADE